MKRIHRDVLGAAAGLALLVFVAGGCTAETSRPKHNACGWPNHCGNDVVDTLSEIVGWAQEDMLKDRTKTPIYDRMARALERGRDPDLTNGEGKHVCLLENPDPCDELRDIQEAARAARNAPDSESKEQWAKVADRLDRWPSGR